MRLYLSADSEKNIGYTPDWIQVEFERWGQKYELTLDIQGSIDYDKNSLSCRCKGELVPWALWDCEKGDEIDLYEFSDKEIAEIVCNSDSYTIGIYPVDDEICEAACSDMLSNCDGLFEMFVDEDHYYTQEFKFNTEINL